MSALLVTVLAGCQTTCETQPNIAAGGRIQSLAVHPIYNTRLLAASETGGLFQSSDGGAKWAHVGGLPSWDVRDVVYSPASPNVVLATTGPGFTVPTNGGIWRSTDDGSTWSKVPSGTSPPSARCRTRSGAYALSYEPGGSTVYAATDCGLAVSTDDGATWTFTILDPARAPGLDSIPDLVWSVLAGPSGRTNAGAESGLWWRPNGTTAFQRSFTPNGGVQGGIIHAYAASPFNRAHIFLAAWPQSLYLSTDGGQIWTQVTAPSVWNRGVFVRTGVRSGLALNHFEVYWGSGNTLVRQEFTHAAAGPVGTGTWTPPTVDHSDPADVAFGSGTTGPVLLATDGGAHRTTDGGATWTFTGGGDGGLNALQITELTGQAVSGSNAHQDLYFGTQDNSIVASSDYGSTWPNQICCEGFYLRVPPTSVDHNTARLTGVTCGACMNFTTNPHLAAFTGWPNAPDGDSDANDVDGNPFLIGPSRYIQATVNNDVTPTVFRFKRTEDDGANWSDAFDIPEELRGRPIIVGPPTDPTIWQPIRRPGQTTTGADRVELVRVTNLYASGGPTIRYVDLPATGGLGVFPTMFAWYWVFGVNPFRPNQIIAPDIESKTVRRSTSAGTLWSTDNALTQLVTAGGGRYFVVDGAFPNLHMIDWDPTNRCHVLVGTGDGGVFRSPDQGASWAAVDGSGQITNLSSFYFPPTGRVRVSSYGRGLWSIDVKRKETCADLATPIDTSVVGPKWTDFVDLPPKAIFDPRRPPPCIRCRYIAVRYGQITGVTFQKGRLTRVRMTGGVIQELDQQWQEIPLSVENEIAAGAPDFPNHPGLAAVHRAGEVIRAIRVEGDSITGAIVSDQDLQTPLQRTPYIRVLTNDMRSGMPQIRAGEEITIVGTGFASARQRGSPIVVRLNGQELKGAVQLDERGGFRMRLRLEQAPGEYVVEVEQRDGKRLVRDRTRFLIVTGDPRPNQDVPRRRS